MTLLTKIIKMGIPLIVLLCFFTGFSSGKTIGDNKPNEQLYPDYQTYRFDSIEIRGPLDFINMIYEGLATLKLKSHNHYRYVCNHAKRIIFKGDGEQMEVVAYTYIDGNKKSFYDIYFIARTVSVTNPSDYGPLVASIIVHESAHLAGWDEPMAYYLQVETLKKLNASKEMINYWETEFKPIIELKDLW